MTVIVRVVVKNTCPKKKQQKRETKITSPSAIFTCKRLEGTRCDTPGCSCSYPDIKPNIELTNPFIMTSDLLRCSFLEASIFVGRLEFLVWKNPFPSITVNHLSLLV